MSTINLRVNTDVMKDQSNLVRNDVDNIKRHWTSIEKIIKGSRNYWEGEASDAHIKVYRDIEADVNKVISRLADNAVKLQQDAGVYEAAEATIQGETSQLKSNIF